MLVRVSVVAPPSTDARLLGRTARGWAIAVAAVAAAVTLSMAVAFAGDRGHVSTFDANIMVHIYEWYPDRTALAHRVSDLGGGVVVFVVAAALAAVSWFRGRPREVVLAILGPSVAIMVTEYVLKPTVHRRLLGYVTYPSGHTTGAFSLATLIAVQLLAPRTRLPVAVRVVSIVALLSVCTAVAISLVAANYHVPTDTIGGAGVAISTVLFLAVGIDAVADRAFRRR